MQESIIRDQSMNSLNLQQLLINLHVLPKAIQALHSNLLYFPLKPLGFARVPMYFDQEEPLSQFPH